MFTTISPEAIAVLVLLWSCWTIVSLVLSGMIAKRDDEIKHLRAALDRALAQPALPQPLFSRIDRPGDILRLHDFRRYRAGQRQP